MLILRLKGLTWTADLVSRVRPVSLTSEICRNVLEVTLYVRQKIKLKKKSHYAK